MRVHPAHGMVGALLTLLLVVPLLAGAGAGHPASASASTPAGPAGTLMRSTYRLQVVSANLDGAERRYRGPRLRTVQRVVSASEPDVVMLQEVCWSQYRRFVRAHRAWIAEGERVADHFRFQKLRRHTGCTRGDRVQRHGLVLASRHVLRRVVAHKLPNRRARTPHVYRLFCADVAVRRPLLAYADDAVRACVTHLRAGRGRRSDAGLVRRKQTMQIRRILAPQVRADRAAIVLAGDFNSVPQKGAMSQLYRLSRAGRLSNPRGTFYEADQNGSYGPAPTGPATGPERITCRVAPNLCRWGEPTHRSARTRRKIDYVFFGANRAQAASTRTPLGFTEPHLHGEVVPSPTASHSVVSAWADLELDLP